MFSPARGPRRRIPAATIGIVMTAFALNACGEYTAGGQPGLDKTSHTVTSIVGPKKMVELLVDASDFPDSADADFTTVRPPAWTPNAQASVVAAHEVHAEVFAMLETETGLAEATDVGTWLLALTNSRFGGDFSGDPAVCLEFFTAVEEFADVGALFDYDLIATHRSHRVELVLDVGTVATEALRFDGEARAEAFVDYVRTLGAWCGGLVSGGRFLPFMQYEDVALPDLAVDHVTFDVALNASATDRSGPVTRVSFLQHGNVVVRVTHEADRDDDLESVFYTAADKLAGVA